jgi:hypothetical protein
MINSILEVESTKETEENTKQDKGSPSSKWKSVPDSKVRGVDFALSEMKKWFQFLPESDPLLEC